MVRTMVRRHRSYHAGVSGVAPAGFVMNMNSNGYDIAKTHDAVVHLQQYETHKPALNHAIENAPVVAESSDEPGGEFHCDSTRTSAILNQAQRCLMAFKAMKS